MARNEWSQTDLNYLKENAWKRPWPEISKRLGRTVLACQQRVRKFGIVSGRPFTEEQIAIIRQKYATTDTREIATEIGRTTISVSRMANNLGIFKDPEYLAVKRRDDAKRFLQKSSKSYRFPKGHVPANKGLRRPGWSAGRMKETQFKKGQRPPNTVAVGTEVVSTDGYKKIKIAEPSVWEYVHRLTWEKHNGPIPAGSLIRFKDGDKMNCSIENLMLVTRTEHALYNSQWKFPAEIVPAMAALSELNKELKNAEKK